VTLSLLKIQSMVGWQEGATMPYREVTMIEIKEIVRLWLAEVPKQQIGRMLGVDRKTVRRYTKLAAKHGLAPGDDAGALTDERLAAILVALKTSGGRPRGKSWDLCVEHRDFIEKKLKDVKLSKIRRLLRRRGTNIPYATLHRFAVSQLGYSGRAHTIPVADGEPGGEVQLDTGWVGWLEPGPSGKRRRFRAWIFTAVVSRHRFVWPVLQETTATAIEACEEAWEFFGGIFKVLIPDNTKAIIDTPDPLGAHINATFLEYAQMRGFHIDPARSRRATDKPRVERAVQSVRDDCFAGESLHMLDHARCRARYWCLNEYGMRRHASTYRMPLEHFHAEEQPHLLPAPTERYDVPLWCNPKVARDQLAQVDRALYSLPDPYVGKILQARADRSTVRFYSGGVIAKIHPRVPPGHRSIDPNDYPPEKTAYAMRDIAFLQHQAARHGQHVGQLASIILEGPLPWTRMRRVYALLSLVRKYGEQRVEEVCTTALSFEMHDVRRLKRMLENATPLPPLAGPVSRTETPHPRYLRPASDYALPPARTECPPTNDTQGENQ
jgi:transposase